MLRQLHDLGSPATTVTTGGRYFGFVTGGVLPPVVAAKWLADAWDQNAALYVMSPVASKLEAVCQAWLIDLLGCFWNAWRASWRDLHATVVGLAAAARSCCADKLGRQREGTLWRPSHPCRDRSRGHSTAFKALALLAWAGNG